MSETDNPRNYTDLTGFHQSVKLPGASLKTCQVLRDCIVTNPLKLLIAQFSQVFAA
jgi:hypothetical protein